MFLADKQFRMDAPVKLSQPGIEFFHVIESTMDLTVWLVRVLDTGSSESHSRYRKFLVDDVVPALRILLMPQWSARSLFALLPGNVSGLDQPSLQRCGAIWKCAEPDGVGICWRVKAGAEIFLLSGAGTTLGEEVNAELIWSDIQHP